MTNSKMGIGFLERSQDTLVSIHHFTCHGTPSVQHASMDIRQASMDTRHATTEGRGAPPCSPVALGWDSQTCSPAALGWVPPTPEGGCATGPARIFGSLGSRANEFANATNWHRRNQLAGQGSSLGRLTRTSPTHHRMRIGALAAMTVVCAIAGCATPRGVLFPPIDPPMVWPASPEIPRIKLVGKISGSGDLNAGRSGGEAFGAFFRGPRPAIPLSSPHGVATCTGCPIAVADPGSAAVHLIDLDSREHTVVSGWGDERFGAPIALTWARGRLFATDAMRKEVIELTRDGTVRQCFGSEILARPVGIVYVKSRDQLYVVDGDAHCVRMFDRSGRYVASFGIRGSAPGMFNYPSHIGYDGQDTIAVVDSGNFRVQLFDLDGTLVVTFGQQGNGAGDFALPKGVAFDSEGHIYVVDARFENVQVFDRRGRLLLAFGTEGGALGEFSLPAGLAIDAEDRIFLADSGNRRIQVFQFLRVSS